MLSQLENRLIKLTFLICQLCNTLHKNNRLNRITGQLINSSADATLSYMDSQEAVSKADAIMNLIVTQDELQIASDGLKLLRNTISANELHSLKRCQIECDQIAEIIKECIALKKRLKDNNPQLVYLYST